MNFLYNLTGYVKYEHINITIPDGSFTKMLLLVSKYYSSYIDDVDTSCNGYYIIFTWTIYNLQ